MRTFESFEEFCTIFDIKVKNVTIENNKYFILEEYLKTTKDKIGRKMFAGGTFLGYKKRKQFFPSIALLDIVVKNYEKKITVDKKTGWLFLCGRDIFAKSLEEAMPKGYVVVQNDKQEILGLGYGKKDLVENVLDRGNFLRREKK